MSSSAHFDEDYAEAVAAGEIDIAETIIEEAAHAAGFRHGPFYHGVGAQGKFTRFDPDMVSSTSGNYGHAGGRFYFAHTHAEATAYSVSYGGTGEVIPVYLRVNKPMTPDLWPAFLEDHPELWTRRVHPVQIKADWIRSKLADCGPSLFLFDAIKTKGYEEGFAIYMEMYKLDEARFDLNDVAELADEYFEDWKVEVCRTMFGEEPVVLTEVDYPSITEVTNLGRNITGINDALQTDGFDAVMMIGEITVFEPSQIKSAEGIVMDDAKAIIPPSLRFSESEDIRGGVSATQSVRLTGRMEVAV